MIRNAQARPKWLATIFIGSAAILLFAPSAAWAGSGHHHSDRYRTHGEYQSHFEHRHHVSHKRNHHGVYRRNHLVSHRRHHQRGERRGYETHHIGYYCRPCNHYFSARDELYDHVAHQHQVPFRHLSVVVSFGSFGWIFFG